MENNLTQEEKIDYIYKTLYKREKRDIINSYIKWLTRIFIVSYLLYFYFYTLPILKQDIINSLKIELPEKGEIIDKAKEIFNFNKK